MKMTKDIICLDNLIVDEDNVNKDDKRSVLTGGLKLDIHIESFDFRWNVYEDGYFVIS